MKIKKIVGLVTLLSMGLVSVSLASIDKNLKYGQRDKEVTELQEFLIDKGLLKSTPSTYFGLLTLKAVKAYQMSIGVSSTGFVGVLTREKINKEIESEVASSDEAEKAETPVTTNAPQTNTQVTTNTNPATTNSDSIYDSNTKIDTIGRKITITQEPNYKFLNIVRAKVDVGGGKILTGFFYKNTKTFMTEEDISQQQAITDEIMKKKLAVSTAPNQQEIPQASNYDVCKNIEGIQTKVPSGMLADSAGSCFTQQTSQNTNTSSVQQTNSSVPIKVLEVGKIGGWGDLTNFRVTSNKELDFEKLQVIKNIFSKDLSGNACRTNYQTQIRECADWSKTELLPVKVVTITKENYGDVQQCYGYAKICGIIYYNITLDKDLSLFTDQSNESESSMAIKIKVFDKEGNSLTSREGSASYNKSSNSRSFSLDAVYNP